MSLRRILLILMLCTVAACAATTDRDAPVSITNSPGTDDPGAIGPGAPRVVVPKPGQLDVQSISAQSFSATIDGRHVVITVDYTSGVEPCYVLDSIAVSRTPGSIEITLLEGHGPGNGVCREIAEYKRTLVDLGDLESGTYQISDSTGGANPISVTVP
ncbi:MAG: hypothetical protein E4H24_01500 [Thermomicrobiales bacterium]|nr:MAG: hypothetical protein E4H24_01500 [Thermomicrobiales bacterium]